MQELAFDITALAHCLPLIGIAACLVALGDRPARPGRRNCLRPARPGRSSKLYVLEPFAKRGEMDQGILRFTWYSLVLVAKGYALAC